jgi:hypothetical protein
LGVVGNGMFKEEDCRGSCDSHLGRSGIGERRLPNPAGGRGAVALAEEHLEWGRCRSKEELHDETHVGSEELKSVERHTANEIRREEVAPRDARLETIATESLGAGIDAYQALHRTERNDVVDAESVVGNLQEVDPELDVPDLGQLQFDRPNTFGNSESLIQAAQEMSRERDHVGGVVESTESSSE